MGVLCILVESSVASVGPSFVELSESSGFLSVHSSVFGVGLDDGVIVINVGFEDALSNDGVVSLSGKSSEFLGPGSDSRVF